jgi:tetratricopeptide (TPR) repeat protein
VAMTTSYDANNIRATLLRRSQATLIALVSFVVFAPASYSHAQQGIQNSSDQATYQADKQRAIDLYREGKSTEVLPLLERLGKENPQDVVVHEMWGVMMNTAAAAEPDADKRKQMRMRAYEILTEAKKLGDNSPLLNTLLGGIPPDGHEVSFSSVPEAEAAMRIGEASFAIGNFDAAQASYEKALAADPNLYYAPLDIGDMYYRRKQYADAGKWFARAIQVDPDKETAYRYWGDALLKDGQTDAARDKYIEGLIAEPYTRTSWIGLAAWAQQLKLTLAHPDLRSPNSLTAKDGKTNITIDASTLNSKDGSSAWMTYEITRAAWQTKKFADAYPLEKEYRHSVAEEVDAYTLVADRAAEGLKSGEFNQLTPALASLVKIKEENLLEAYILLARADAGIARDYPAYRDAHRDRLRQYILEWVIRKPAGQ